MRYLTISEYRIHSGCTHPVHDHNRAGCLVYSCRCVTPRYYLAGPSGFRQIVDVVLRCIGGIWLLVHAYALITWFLP